MECITVYNCCAVTSFVFCEKVQRKIREGLRPYAVQSVLHAGGSYVYRLAYRGCALQDCRFLQRQSDCRMRTVWTEFTEKIVDHGVEAWGGEGGVECACALHTRSIISISTQHCFS